MTPTPPVACRAKHTRLPIRTDRSPLVAFPRKQPETMPTSRTESAGAPLDPPESVSKTRGGGSAEDVRPRQAAATNLPTSVRPWRLTPSSRLRSTNHCSTASRPPLCSTCARRGCATRRARGGCRASASGVTCASRDPCSRAGRRAIASRRPVSGVVRSRGRDGAHERRRGQPRLRRPTRAHWRRPGTSNGQPARGWGARHRSCPVDA